MNHTRLFVSIAVASFFFSSAALAEADKKTERLWKSKCASCHGQAGKGDTDKGKEMKVADMSAAAYQGKKDDDLKKVILDGVKTEKGGVKQEMDGYKGELTPEQVDALIVYTRTFKK